MENNPTDREEEAKNLLAEFGGHFDGFMQDYEILRDEIRGQDCRRDNIPLLKKMLIAIKFLAFAFNDMEERASAETLSEIRKLKSEIEPPLSTLQFGSTENDRLAAYVHEKMADAMLHAILSDKTAVQAGGVFLTITKPELWKLHRTGLKHTILSEHVPAQECGKIQRLVINFWGAEPVFEKL